MDCRSARDRCRIRSVYGEGMKSCLTALALTLLLVASQPARAELDFRKLVRVGADMIRCRESFGTFSGGDIRSMMRKIEAAQSREKIDDPERARIFAQVDVESLELWNGIPVRQLKFCTDLRSALTELPKLRF
jgi:hypothetical protein